MSAKIKELLQEACENTGGDVSLREYSGRGMYGRKCMAITGSISACQRVIADALKEASSEMFSAAVDMTDDDCNAVHEQHSEFQGMIDSLVQFDWDNMGLDYVVYWTDIEWVEDELPTDQQIDNMSVAKLIKLLRDDWAEYVAEDDDLKRENIHALAKVVRDRIQEDTGE